MAAARWRRLPLTSTRVWSGASPRRLAGRMILAASPVACGLMLNDGTTVRSRSATSVSPWSTMSTEGMASMGTIDSVTVAGAGPAAHDNHFLKGDGLLAQGHVEMRRQTVSDDSLALFGVVADEADLHTPGARRDAREFVVPLRVGDDPRAQLRHEDLDARERPPRRRVEHMALQRALGY